MTDPIFKQSYTKLRGQFGETYFGINKGIQLFKLFEPIPDDVGQELIDQIVNTKTFSANNPPGFEAFKAVVEKAMSEKKRAEYRQEKAKASVPPSWDQVGGDGLSKTLNQMGFKSIGDLIQNNFKPRK